MKKNDADTWTFQELVTWATWEIMEGIAKGEALRGIVFRILMAARNAKLNGS